MTTKDDIAIRLLASSLKGKALKYYRGLAHNTISNMDEIRERVCKHFEDKSDHLSLLEQLTIIKRAPQKYMIDFNYRF